MQTGVARLLFTMPHHCAVPGCTSNSKSSPGLAFHCFPSDADLRKLWLTRIRRDEVAGQFQVTSSTRVCGNHFPPSAYFLAGHAGERKRERKTERKSNRLVTLSPNVLVVCDMRVWQPVLLRVEKLPSLWINSAKKVQKYHYM